MIRSAAEFVGLACVMAAYLAVSLPLLLAASALSTALECAVGAFDVTIGALGRAARRGGVAK